MSQKLPLGLQDFRKIIENGFKYIDKTKYILQLCQNPGAFFLSRPRRFGKSINLAILQELYSGSRELFKGLWIEDKWDWSKKHPVIRLSFTSIGFQQNGLSASLSSALDQLAEEKGIPTIEGNISNKFKHLITSLAKTNKVVVLIDEYDAPIVHYIGGKDLSVAYEDRDLLKSFYSVLKDLDAYLELIFITGVSKFSKVGVFSGLNNLTDLTAHSEYATMFGYTQAELEQYFSEEITTTAKILALSREELLDQLRWWYNGYRFHLNAETVYNPVSINMFFYRKEFDNFWFETGTPTFLINLLREQGIYNLELVPQSKQSMDTFELEDLNPYGLMYQTGYLTIKSRNAFGLYELGYPNHEVEHAMKAYLLESYSGLHHGDGLPLVFKLETFFRQQQVDKVMQTLQSVFKSIPYQLQESYPEKFFHAAIHLLFTYMGLSVHSEVCTSDGRLDALVETDTHIYILEFKLDESAEVALAQIRRKEYYQAFWNKGKAVVGIGVNFSSATKNVEEWKVEVMEA